MSTSEDRKLFIEVQLGLCQEYPWNYYLNKVLYFVYFLSCSHYLYFLLLLYSYYVNLFFENNTISYINLLKFGDARGSGSLEAYSKSYQTYMMKRFVKIVHSLKPFTIFA